MILKKALEGRFVDLVSASADDAKFILGLRSDAAISRYLPRLNNTVDEQIIWIEAQREDSSSYYFVLKTKASESIGTIGVYDILDGHAETGRFASIGDGSQNVEALVLLLDFVFHTLGLDYITCWVNSDNKSVVNLNTKIGYEWNDYISEDGKPCVKGILTAERYENAVSNIRELLKRINI